jgi:hypothetical protein
VQTSKYHIGNTIYIKSENDKIRQLISISKDQFQSSHQNYYGKPIYKEKSKPILSSKYGKMDHTKRKVSIREGYGEPNSQKS